MTFNDLTRDEQYQYLSIPGANGRGAYLTEVASRRAKETLEKAAAETIRNRQGKPAADLTDVDITALAGSGPDASLRAAALYAQRHKAQQSSRAPYTREANSTGRGPAMTIAVGGAQGIGKTTVLVVIMQALANAGLLVETDTYNAVTDPQRLLDDHRVLDDGAVESVTFALDRTRLEDVQQDIRWKQRAVPTPTEDEKSLAPFTIDAVYPAHEVEFHGWREALATAILSIDSIPTGTEAVSVTVRKQF